MFSNKSEDWDVSSPVSAVESIPLGTDSVGSDWDEEGEKLANKSKHDKPYISRK